MRASRTIGLRLLLSALAAGSGGALTAAGGCDRPAARSTSDPGEAQTRPPPPPADMVDRTGDERPDLRPVNLPPSTRPGEDRAAEAADRRAHTLGASPGGRAVSGGGGGAAPVPTH